MRAVIWRKCMETRNLLKIILINTIILFSLSYNNSFAAVTTTEIAKLANSLAPGEWGELTTTGADNAFSASNSIFEYCDKMVWDPVVKQVLFYGSSDPGGAQNTKFIRYLASTNAWDILPDPPFTGGIKHSYKHLAIDVKGRRMYYRPMGPDNRNFYSIGLDNLPAGWTKEADISGLSYVQDASALSYFGARNSIILNSGSSNKGHGLTEFSLVDKTWKSIPGTFKPAGVLHSIIECNPVHNVCIFGGGDDTNNLWKLNPDLTTVDLGAATPVGNLDTRFANTTVDPGTGDYLILTRDNKFYRYDVTTGAAGTWYLVGQGASIPPFNGYTSNAPTFHMSSTPISTYGVVMYVQWRDTGSKVWLYKHSPNSGTEIILPDKPAKPAISR